MSLRNALQEMYDRAAEKRKNRPQAGEGHRQLEGHLCKLVPVEPGDKTLGGRHSTRARQNKWVRT